MTTDKAKRKLVSPGLYRRGDVYEIRVRYSDPVTGEARERWRKVGTSKKQARNALIQARAAALQGTMVSRKAHNLTTAEFLRNHYLPYLYTDAIPAGRIDPNTVFKYAGYVENKVIPAIGDVRVADVNSGTIERLLSLARYARVSPEALGRWQDDRDPARRGGRSK